MAGGLGSLASQDSQTSYKLVQQWYALKTDNVFLQWKHLKQANISVHIIS